MLLTFKTLDHKIFKYEASEEDTVDDIRVRIEGDFGQENIYKLIYAGKILKDDQTLKSYKINPKQFIVLMITKPQKQIEEEKEDRTFVHEDEKTSEPDTQKPSPCSEIVLNEECLLEAEEESQDVSSSCDFSLSREDSLDIASPVTAVQTAKVGLEFIEEQIKQKSENHFLTHKDFTIALEVVMDMEYLADIGNKMKSPEDITIFLEDYFKDKSFLIDIKTTVISRIDDLLSVSPNTKQMDAFLTDLISIYAQEREIEPVLYTVDLSSEDDDSDDEEAALEVVITAFQRNVENIVAMGFLREEVEVALRAAFNNPDVAVDYLIGGIPPSAFAPEENPIAFLRNNEEFQHIRYLVQSDPGALQPLLLTFGQKHPELMEVINKNKLTFVRMLHEPDRAKGFMDDSSLVVDPSVQDKNLR